MLFPLSGDVDDEVEMCLCDPLLLHMWPAALHLAAKRGNEKMINALIKGGASVDSKNSTGQTPLHLAASGGHDKACQVLIASGASTEASHSSPQSPKN